MSQFEFQNIKSHIRSLAYGEPFLLAGIGSMVFVWYQNCSGEFKFIKSIPLMQQDIIGIKFENTNKESNELKVIFYSIRFLQYCQILFNVNDLSFELVTQYKTNVIYMILDLIFFNKKVISINSRNEIMIHDLNKKNVQQRVFGLQKSILYSAKFLELDDNYLIAASGTVFKQVLLWSLEFEQTNESIECTKTLQTLYGHDGVIFDIDYHSHLNILITASDDRSIRIWKGQSDFNDRTLIGWQNNNFSLSHIYYGHEARIWKVCSMISTVFPICLSVGEDSTMIVWSLFEPFRMIKRKKFGRNNRIWSLEVTPTHIVCGGSDGSLQFTLFEDLLQINQFKLLNQKWELSHQLKSICYVKTTDNLSLSLFSCCVEGKFYSLDEKLNHTPIVFEEYENLLLNIFNDYIKLAWNDNRTHFLIGSKYGHLGLLNFDHESTIKLIFLEKIFDSKILDINFVNDNLVIICLIGGIFNIYKINKDKETCLDRYLNQDYVLPESRHRWSSSALIYKNLIVIGDSSGNVFAYYIDISDPFLKLRNIHGHNEVTCLKKKPDSCLMYSSGRNGKIMEYYIEQCSKNKTVINFFPLRTYAFFTEMEWIGGFDFDQLNNLRFVYGFESRKFLIWNMYQGMVVFEEDCGGGHRSWDILLQPLNNDSRELVEINFCYNQKNNVMNVTRTTQCQSSLSFWQYSSIPRKINCCAKLIEQTMFTYFMIGGEDKSIQLIFYDKENENFKLEKMLWSHISNVTSIKCLNLVDVNYAVSVGGRSQLVLWKFWFTDNQNQELICQEKGVNFLGLFNEQTEFEDNIRRSNVDDSNSILDVRYLDVDFIPLSNDNDHPFLELAIIVACSDAAYRFFRFNEKNSEIFLLKKIDLGRSCLLRTKILPHEDLIKLDIFLYALTNNDGQIFLWSFDGSPQINEKNCFDGKIDYHLLLERKLHQTGINALDLFHNKNVLMVASGGDDNTITISLIDISYTPNDGLCLNFIRSFHDHSIHTCQITELMFHGLNQQSQPNLISISIDQQMICWNILYLFSIQMKREHHDDGNGDEIAIGEKIRPIDRCCLSIADVSSMCLINTNRSSSSWVICGEGFQLVRYCHLNNES